MKLIIVGGVAAGASVAARARRLNEEAEIIILERGPIVSFSNCCLPNHLSGQIKNANELILMTPKKFLDDYNIKAYVNNEVISVNSEKKNITIKNTSTNIISIENYDKLVVTPGADAFVPPFIGLDKIPHYNLKTVQDAKNISEFINVNNPKHITVVGGGFIGLEAAENLRHLGIEITLIEGSNQIIPFVDEDMSLFGQEEMVKHGIKIIVNDLVERFDDKSVILKSGLKINTDMLILAIGIRPATKWLESANIEMDRGYIKVNKNYQTSNEHIYAAGDAILVENGITKIAMPLAMAGPANKQGRLIADHIFGLDVNNKGYIGTGIVKLFDMNISCTGLREKDLENTNYNYDVVYAAPSDIVSIMPNSNLLFSKLIFDKNDGRVLGAQFASYGSADKRADVIATAIKAKMTVLDLCDLELAYAPAFSTGKDVINKLGYIATNILQNRYKQVRFSDVYNLLENNAQIIDVRNLNEYEILNISSVKHISMDKIRLKLNELNKNKPVYVHCNTGQRSYNIVLILKHYGFDAYNIAGGIQFVRNYETMKCYNNKNRKNILNGKLQLK